MTEPTNPAAGSGDSLPTTDDASLERLKRFGGGKLLSEMIALFCSAAPERISAARTGVSAGDAHATEQAMHSLKSSSAQLGALRMQRLCEQAEMLARGGSVDQVGALVHELVLAFPRVQSWLERARQPEVA